MRLFLTTIEAWAETKFFDLRKEATVVLARKIVAATATTTSVTFR